MLCSAIRQNTSNRDCRVHRGSCCVAPVPGAAGLGNVSDGPRYMGAIHPAVYLLHRSSLSTRECG
jgi:hypothetical protein